LYSVKAARIRRFVRKGTMKLLLLKALQSRPMHGYEAAKEISTMFNGIYEPSPGVIYPTLQWLSDQNYVEGEQADGKTVYTMTTAGKNFLKENEASLKEAMRFAEGGSVSPDDFPILRSANRLERTIRVFLPEMSGQRRVEVAKVLDEARHKIEDMMEDE
jgi:DNA-binding PadR family transcriptional regulator